MVGTQHAVSATNRVPRGSDIGRKGLAGIVREQTPRRIRQFIGQPVDLLAQQVGVRTTPGQSPLRRQRVGQQHAKEDVLAPQVIVVTPMPADPRGLRGVGEQVRRGIDRGARIMRRTLALLRALPGLIEVLGRAQIEHRTKQRPLGSTDVVQAQLAGARIAVTLRRPLLERRRQRAMPAPALARRLRPAEGRIIKRVCDFSRPPQEQHTKQYGDRAEEPEQEAAGDR